MTPGIALGNSMMVERVIFSDADGVWVLAVRIISLASLELVLIPPSFHNMTLKNDPKINPRTSSFKPLNMKHAR